jgi:hypothetical protein
VDLACAYRYTRRLDFLEHMARITDYWWGKRDERGLLQIESRTPADMPKFLDTNTPGQTLSLAISLLETADLLEELGTELASVMRERAALYIEGFLAAPHDVSQGVFALDSLRSTNALKRTMAVWGSVYGEWPVAYTALDAMCGYRLTGNTRLLDWVEAAGRAYRQEPFPTETHVPALDAGLAVALLADLYDVTGASTWREAGLNLAKRVMEIYFDAAALPRGAAGIEWYESQMGPGYLLHGLARMAQLATARGECPVKPDYTAR